MRLLLRWLVNGLCLLSLAACPGAVALWVRAGHAQDYVVAARPSGRWWLAGSGPDGFVLTAWRGEPARVLPRLYSCPAPPVPPVLAPGSDGPFLLGLSPQWRQFGFRGASESKATLALPGRPPAPADLDLWHRQHDGEPIAGLQADCNGPWPGWWAFRSTVSGSGWVWMIYADDCTELVASPGAATGVTAVPPILWLARLARRRVVRRRRRRRGLCRRCGYDLTGNTSGVCSECGEVIEASGRLAT